MNWLHARNEYRAALQAGETGQVSFRADGDAKYAEAIRHFASLTNGVAVHLDGERLPELRKGRLKASTDWCRVFVARGDTRHSGTLIVRREGVAMFTRLLAGVPAQVTLEVSAPNCFNAAGDGLTGEHALELERLASSIILNPWSAARVPREDTVELYLQSGEVIKTTSARAGQEVKLNNVGLSELDPLASTVRVSIMEPTEQQVVQAEVVIGTVLACAEEGMGLDALFRHMEEEATCGLTDAAYEQAMDGMPKGRQKRLNRLIDELIDAGHEWEGFFPQQRTWCYRRDYVIKRCAGHRTQTNFQANRFHRLLRAWDFTVAEMVGLRGRLLGSQGRLRFTVGLLVGDVDYMAEISEWGGHTFILVNPAGVRFAAPLRELVLLLRDRAAHVVAHIGCPDHSERWSRAYDMLLEESVPLLAQWQRELCWLNSVGASTEKYGR